MGNHLVLPQKDTPTSTMRKYLKSKLKSTRKTASKSVDGFIIKHLQNNIDNDHNIDIGSFDQRRLVFISLIGLYKTWKNVPSVLLYSALLLMPLHKKWIYHPSEYTEEIQKHFISELSIFTNVADINQFIELLKWKDSQGLVMWMLDDSQSVESMGSTKQIHPFWYTVSTKMQNLYDPVTGHKYKPLNFNTNWWQYKENKISILLELYCLTMRYNTMKEIISESNPMSLRPLISYPNNVNDDKLTNNSMKKLTNQQLLCLYDDQNINMNVDIKQNEGVWFISDDY